MNFSEWIMQESGFAHVRRMLFGDIPRIHTVGILTAQNPIDFNCDLNWHKGPPNNKEEYNKRANQKLWDQLRAGNYGPIRVKGRFDKVDEDSFLVPNMSRDDVIELGRDYCQEAVIWGEKRTDKNDNPYFRFEYIDCKTGEINSVRSIHIGNEDVQGRSDYYTKVKGRKFIIPFFGDPHARKVPGSKYGMAVNIPMSPATPWDTDELASQVETFHIPFFDDPENTELETDGFSGEISYYSDRLADCPYVHKLVNEIRHSESKLSKEGASRKSYWMYRGIIRECLDKLRHL
jgi:hypothetical protein